VARTAGTCTLEREQQVALRPERVANLPEQRANQRAVVARIPKAASGSRDNARLGVPAAASSFAKAGAPRGSDGEALLPSVMAGRGDVVDLMGRHLLLEGRDPPL
jgi:hypothetical protein